MKKLSIIIAILTFISCGSNKPIENEPLGSFIPDSLEITCDTITMMVKTDFYKSFNLPGLNPNDKDCAIVSTLYFRVKQDQKVKNKKQTKNN